MSFRYVARLYPELLESRRELQEDDIVIIESRPIDTEEIAYEAVHDLFTSIEKKFDGRKLSIAWSKEAKMLPSEVMRVYMLDTRRLEGDGSRKAVAAASIYTG